VPASDQLLTHFWRDIDRFPRRGQGTLSGSNGFAWRTSVLANRMVKPVTFQVVRVEVIDRAAGAVGAIAGVGRAQRPALVSVDVVLPVKTTTP